MQWSITCTKEVIDQTIDIVQERVLYFIDNRSIPNDNHAYTTLMQELESGRKVFEEVDTPYKMSKIFSDKM